jgi:hypothetical protein
MFTTVDSIDGFNPDPKKPHVFAFRVRLAEDVVVVVDARWQLGVEPYIAEDDLM